MLEFVKGDFFDFDADIRVNTVNCVGVMGAGAALAFKNKYPEMFKEYVKLCKSKEIGIGKPSVWKQEDMFSRGIEIINFPTKIHWRNPSEYEYVESGLIWLSEYLSNKSGLTMTLPALGCGHGGLDWEKVKSLIIGYLDSTPNRVLVFEPEPSKKAGSKTSYKANINLKLQALNVHVLNSNEKSYPTGLIRYTEKDLYVLGDMSTDFDISIISSTKPNDEEKIVVHKLVEYCGINNRSILFGGSAFDKKMAYFAMTKGIKTGVFLPNGILSSAEKMKSNESKESVTILSIGDPFKSFYKKEYMPSVLSRMFISHTVVFTTDKLKWLDKQSNVISKNSLNLYFTSYESLSQEDYMAAINNNAKPMNLNEEISIKA